MKKTKHSWLVMEVGDPFAYQKLKNPFFGALELTPHFMRRVRLLERLSRKHHLDTIQTRLTNTQVYWDIHFEDAESIQIVTYMDVNEDLFSFRVECVHQKESILLANERLGQAFFTSLEELEVFYEGPNRIHFLQLFDRDYEDDHEFIQMALGRMLELKLWDDYKEEMQNLLAD